MFDSSTSIEKMRCQVYARLKFDQYVYITIGAKVVAQRRAKQR